MQPRKVIVTAKAALVLFASVSCLMCLNGCMGGSARDLYYSSRAIEAQARDGDGSIVIVTDNSEDLRRALQRAQRIQLAEVDAQK